MTDRAATNTSGCRRCGAAWTETQLVFRADDGTWWTTCPECGHRQQWAWIDGRKVTHDQ